VQVQAGPVLVVSCVLFSVDHCSGSLQDLYIYIRMYMVLDIPYPLSNTRTF
jgi:hypothetical protein